MEIAAALASLKAVVDIAQGAVNARDDTKAKEAVGNMSQKLLDLYVASFEREDLVKTLKSTIESLRAQVKDLEAQLVERALYQLTRLGQNGYAYLLVEDGAVQSADGPVYFCQPCRDKGIKSILRPHEIESAAFDVHRTEWECIENSKHTIY